MAKSPPSGYPRISPYLNYEDTAAMVDWLAKAWGLSVRDTQRNAAGILTHAEMSLEDGVIMMGSPGNHYKNPRHLGQSTQSLYVYVDEIDSHYQRSLEAGADIIEAPSDQPYGDRRYGAADPEGHRWYFAERLPD